MSILRLSNWPAGMWNLPMGVPRGQLTAQAGSKVPRKNFGLCIVRKPQTRQKSKVFARFSLPSHFAEIKGSNSSVEQRFGSPGLKLGRTDL